MVRSCILFIFLIFVTGFFNYSPAQQIDLGNLLEYRNLGPHRVGAWISAIAVPATDDDTYKYTYYVSGRYGGVWKTVNNGTTFFQVFDSVGISSIGAIAVATTDPETVYVGTGESYSARSTHAGHGVYKSVNGGKTWESVGLEDTHHISTVLIHPEDKDIVWVAAMGHLFSSNEERGVFKSTDGGKTWGKKLYIDENTGIIDLVIDPEDPLILYAAAYEKYRYPWHYEAGGEHSGVYRSDDGGETWNKMVSGLPVGKLGRIGLGLCYQHPETVYAVVENLNPKPGIVVDETVRMNYMRDPYFDQLIGGEVYRSDDRGITWKKQNQDSCNVSAKAAYSFNKIMVNSEDPDKIYVISDVMLSSLDGGKTWQDCQWPPTNLFLNMFGDHRTFWMDPDDGRHMMIGSDGGLYETYDGGVSMYHRYQLPLGEIYTVEVDNADPYNIYLGLQDHEAWKAPVNGWSGRVGIEDWDLIGMWDGMYTVVDPNENQWVYITTQFGAHRRESQLTGERVSIEPKSLDDENPYRYCWTTPLEMSPHNSGILYTGGQMLLRSLDRGDHWEEISPDLTTNDPVKIAGRGHMMYCTITTISESPVKAGVIWVGTDDGRVHLTRDHGQNWEEFTDPIAALGGDKDYWVSRVYASEHDVGTAYVCKSGFRHDDFRPLVFKTTDFGKSWALINSGISRAPVNVIIEDHLRKDLLFLGNDNGVYFSVNGGAQWQSLALNMPVVAVKDMKIQPRENDLVVGTYGRGAFITDITPLQQWEKLGMKMTNFLQVEDKPVRNYSRKAAWGNFRMEGDNHLSTPNESNGWVLYYGFNGKLPKEAFFVIEDASGKELDLVKLNPEKGFHRLVYETEDMVPGEYVITLVADKDIYQQKASLLPEPQGFE